MRHKRTDRWPVAEESIVVPIPEGGGDQLNLSHTLSRLSLTSGRSEGGGLLLPVVTLDQPLSLQGDNDFPPGSASSIPDNQQPVFSLGDDNCSVTSHSSGGTTKGRSGTINSALESLSEDNDIIEDEESKIVKVEVETNEESKDNEFINQNEGNSDTNVSIVEVESVTDKTFVQCITETSLSSAAVATFTDVTKVRSSSTPSECDNTKDVIHPRSTSDPRGMNPNRLDSQAAVHFKDPDLSVRSSAASILRRKDHHRSSSGSGNEDTGFCVFNLYTLFNGYNVLVLERR